MRIDSVKVALPSRELDNNHIIELVRQHSQGSFDGDLERASP